MNFLLSSILTILPLLSASVNGAPLSSRQAGGLAVGLNIGDKNPDGSCKSAQDWSNAFSDLKTLPNGGFHAVRTFSTSECATLERAVPAGIQAGVKFLVGVWSADEAHFETEKAALVNAIQQHGSSWIVGISVGNEDLYRKAIAPTALADRIKSVKTLVRSNPTNLPASIPIGHADTWTAWQDGVNAPVIQASDFVGHQGYPYWEGKTIDQGADAFWTNLDKTVKGVAAASGGDANAKPVWVTETGWPVSGPSFGASVASTSNASRFWKEVGCSVIKSRNVFWYAYQDYTSTPTFGIFDKNRKVVYDLTC